MEAMLEADFAASDRITLEDWQRRLLDHRVKQLAARIWEYWLQVPGISPWAYCRPSGDARAPVLHIVLGTKNFQRVSDGFRIRLGYRVAVRTADYLQVNLASDEGPLGTRDFRIVVAMIPADEDRTFMRLSYSYTYGSVARLAMQAYLGTIGHAKVGFTVVSRDSGGEPRFVGGMRGAVERNTMRYYLALEAFIGALSTPRAREWQKPSTTGFPRPKAIRANCTK